MKVLLLGLGKMGSLHGKYLDELNIDWCWFDPDTVRTLNDSLSKKRLDVFSHNSLQSFTHFIIATPTHTHEDLLYILLKLNKLNIYLNRLYLIIHLMALTPSFHVIFFPSEYFRP